MKILVLNPPFKPKYGKYSRASRSPAISKGGTVYFPIWLSYLVGILDSNGHNIKFIDAPAKQWSINDVLINIKGFSPNLIVMDTSTPSIYSDVKTASILKKKFPKSFLVFVGTHPTALPKETLKLSRAINAIAIGEYDYTIQELAKSLEQNKNIKNIPGLVLRDKNKIIKTSKRELIPIEELNNFPLISSVYKKYLNYKDYNFAAANYPIIQIMTSRGCPFRCFFCVYPQVLHERKFRPRSAENVVKEFLYIRDNFPDVKQIGIEDDTFTIDKKRVIKICNLLIKKKITIPWYCNTRATTDFETLEKMYQAGCKLVIVGLESGDQQVLNNMKKGITLEQSNEFVKNCKKIGLRIHACFMAGNPGDTKETLEQNLKLAKKLNCDLTQFFPIIVYPGTEAYEWAKKNKYLNTKKFSNWGTKTGDYRCVVDLPDLTGERLTQICNQQYKSYIFTPKFIFSQLKSPESYIRNIRGLFNYIKNTINNH